jgi:glycosyltransferase involved in cell wall biosynthesis
LDLKTIYINGKFTAQATTGVQRVAACLVAALDNHLKHGGAGTAEHWVLLCPASALAPQLDRIAVRQLGPSWVGLHLWEQVLLPLACGDSMLLNLSGSAPAFKKRQICMVHDAAVFDTPQSYQRVFVMWYRWLFRRLARTAQLLLTVSEFSRQRLTHHLRIASDRIALVPNGADHLSSLAADPTILSRHGLEPGRYFVVIGSSNANKNHAAARRAVDALEIADVRLVIVGDDHRRVFADTASPAAAARVIQVGRIDDSQMKALLQAAAGLVFPSRYEGFGLPPLEAMSCRCPVIASNAAAVPEVCGDAAIYVGPTDVDAIAAAMRRLLLEPELRDDLAERGACRAAALTWAASAEALVARLASLGAVEPARP